MNYRQSRIMSLVEAVANTAIGFVVSLLFWIWVIVPVWKLPVNMTANITITCLFTVLSIVRGYAVRRFFAEHIHKFAERSSLWLTR